MSERASQLIGPNGPVDHEMGRWGAGATCATVAPQLTARVTPNHYIYTTTLVWCFQGWGGEAATKPFDI